MYHYVRNERKEQPFSKHKNLEEFKDECQFLKEDKTFLSVKELFQQKTKCNKELINASVTLAKK